MGTGKLLGKPIKLWGNDLRWTSILSRGSRNTLSRFMLQKPGISSVAMSGSALRLHFFFRLHFQAYSGTYVTLNPLKSP